jgi:hypothetical protein
MAMIRNLEVELIQNVAWLRVCAGLLKQMRTHDKNEQDRRAALRLVDEMLERMQEEVKYR